MTVRRTSALHGTAGADPCQIRDTMWTEGAPRPAPRLLVGVALVVLVGAVGMTFIGGLEVGITIDEPRDVQREGHPRGYRLHDVDSWPVRHDAGSVAWNAALARERGDHIGWHRARGGYAPRNLDRSGGGHCRALGSDPAPAERCANRTMAVRRSPVGTLRRRTPVAGVVPPRLRPPTDGAAGVAGELGRLRPITAGRSGTRAYVPIFVSVLVSVLVPLTILVPITLDGEVEATGGGRRTDAAGTGNTLVIRLAGEASRATPEAPAIVTIVRADGGELAMRLRSFALRVAPAS